MKRTIPQIAARLREIAAERKLPELAALADEMKRRPPTLIAKGSSRRMTPELEAEIRTFRRKNPNMTQSAIARHFNVNAGRVSEAINGKV